MEPVQTPVVLGVVRSTFAIAPWGTFLSFNFENSLQAVATAGDSTKCQLWKKYHIYLLVRCCKGKTIWQLLETLLVPESDLLWTRPMGLYLQQDNTNSIYSDASYVGIGGWSQDFAFLWRVTT